MTFPIPPDNRGAGQAGHIDDHNEISDALTSLLQSVAKLPGTQITVSAVQPLNPGNGDIWFNISGNALTVETYLSSVAQWIPTSLSNIPKPSDFSLIAESCELTSCSGTVQPVNQTVYLQKLILRQPETIASVWCAVATPAVSPVPGQNWAGLISSAGALLSSGQISSAALTGIGPVSTALAAVQQVSPGYAWAAFVFNCATPPFLLRGNPVAALLSPNLSPAAYQSAVNGTSSTTLPGSITPSSNVLTGAQAIWAAAS